MLSFAAALVAALLLLAGAVTSGVRHRRRAHYNFVAGFFLALGLAIWRAIVMGHAGGGLHFEAAATAQLLHRIAVGLTFALVPFLVFSGVRLARAPDSHLPERRKGHRGLAIAFVIGVLVSALLGTVMTFQAVAATG